VVPPDARAALVAGVSNAALARVLARDPNPKLEERKQPEKQPVRAGAEIDEIFDSSPYFAALVAGKVGKGQTIEKAMRLDSDADFEKAWVAYAIGTPNPGTQKNFTEDEARDWLAKKGVRAFQDEVRGEIHIRKSRADLGVQLHEALHFHSHDRFRNRVGYIANEGVTEWFTRKIGPEVKVERDINSFLREYTSATHMVDAVGEDLVKKAYFDGDVSALKTRFDELEPGGWDRWLDLLDAQDFKGANALAKKAGSAKTSGAPAPVGSR